MLTKGIAWLPSFCGREFFFSSKCINQKVVKYCWLPSGSIVVSYHIIHSSYIIHHMSNGLNLLHLRKDVAEMVIVFLCVPYRSWGFGVRGHEMSKWLKKIEAEAAEQAAAKEKVAAAAAAANENEKNNFLPARKPFWALCGAVGMCFFLILLLSRFLKLHPNRPVPSLLSWLFRNIASRSESLSGRHAFTEAHRPPRGHPWVLQLLRLKLAVTKDTRKGDILTRLEVLPLMLVQNHLATISFI